MIAVFSDQNLKIDFADVEYISGKSEIFADIAIISQGFDIGKIKVFAETVILCGDDCTEMLENVFCEKLITFGMSSKNTVTISSHSDSEILLSIQREFSAQNGEAITIGEIVVNASYNRVFDDILVAVLKLVLSKKLP